MGKSPHQIDTIAALEALYGEPNPNSLAKEMSRIDANYRKVIEAAPFCAVASIGDGGLDCSPRGDGPGFVKIIDDKTLALPDRPGNRRLDTLRNIVTDPRVELLFLIPGWNEALRVRGRAIVTTDPELLALMKVKEKLPISAIVVSIETLYFQCARAIVRAGLWSEDRRIDLSTLPTAGELLASAITEFDSETYDAGQEERQATSLY